MKTTSKMKTIWKIETTSKNRPPLQIFFWWPLTVTATPQLMLNRKWYQCSEEPVVVLSMKKTGTALICTWTCVRHCMQTKPDSMLLHSKLSWSFPIKLQLCSGFPTSQTCSSPLTWVLQVQRDAPEVATVTRTLKLTQKQKNSLPIDVVKIEKNKISKSEEALPILLELHITWTNRFKWRETSCSQLGGSTSWRKSSCS